MKFPPGLRPAASCQPGKRPSCQSQDVMRKENKRKHTKTVFRVSGWFVFCWFWLANWFQKTSCSIFCWAFRWFVTPCDHTRPSCLAKDFSTSLVVEFLCRLAIGLDTPSISAYFQSKYFDDAKCHDASATHCKKVFGKQEITAVSFKTKRILNCFPSEKFSKQKKVFLLADENKMLVCFRDLSVTSGRTSHNLPLYSTSLDP